MGCYWNTNVNSTLYDLARHAISLCALQKGTDFNSDKGSDHSRNAKHRRISRENCAGTVNVFTQTGAHSTLTTTTTPTTVASADGSIGLSPELRQTAEITTLCANDSDHRWSCPVLSSMFREFALPCTVPVYSKSSWAAIHCTAITKAKVCPQTVQRIRSPISRCAE